MLNIEAQRISIFNRKNENKDQIVHTLYCLLRYFSHGSGLPLRFHVTSGLWVAKRKQMPVHKAPPTPIMTTNGINWKQ